MLEAFQNIVELCSFYSPKPHLAVGANRLFFFYVWIGFFTMLQIGSKLTLLWCTYLFFNFLVLAQYERGKLDFAIVWRKSRSQPPWKCWWFCFGLQLSKNAVNLSLTVLLFLIFTFPSFYIMLLFFLLVWEPNLMWLKIIQLLKKQWATFTAQPTY